MKTVILSAFAVSLLTLGACSDGTSEEDGIAQIEAARANQRAEEMREEAKDMAENGQTAQARYERAVECTATVSAMSDMWNVLARSSPERAGEYSASAEERLGQARALARLSEQYATQAGIERSVVPDAVGAERAEIQQRSQQGDFNEFAVGLGRESDSCINEFELT